MGKRGEKLANGGQMASGDLSIPADILAQTEQRYRSTLSGMQAGKAAASVETLLSQNAMEAVTSRLRRLGVPEPKAVRAASFISEGKARIEGFVESPSPLVAPELPEEVVIGLERILGNNDLMSIRFLDMGSAIGRSVGRVVIRKPGGGLAGYGTGFMVSPQLLLTNNHVLARAEEAAASQIEFNYQDGLQGEPLEAVCFTLAPDTFFLTDRSLDFTLVAVGKPADGAAGLDAFGWNRLSDQSGEVLVGEYVNIIQHPNGERKQLALRENKVTAIAEERFLQYQTDTAPGSSGSPVLNDQWEVVAAHHSGFRNATGRKHPGTRRQPLESVDGGAPHPLDRQRGRPDPRHPGFRQGPSASMTLVPQAPHATVGGREVAGTGAPRGSDGETGVQGHARAVARFRRGSRLDHPPADFHPPRHRSHDRGRSGCCVARRAAGHSGRNGRLAGGRQ